MNAFIVADDIKCSLEKYQFTKILKIWSLNWSRSQDFRIRLHLWQSPSSEVTFYCEAPSKYIVVRKFMKKQCVAAPVAKKLAKIVISAFLGSSFSMESSSSFFLSYIFQRRKRQGWLLNFFLVLFWFFSELFDNIVFEYIYYIYNIC